MNFWENGTGFCQIFEINTTTGAVTPLGAAPYEFNTQGTSSISAFLIDSTHVMTFVDSVTTLCQVFKINTTTGDITPLGSPFEFDAINGQYNSSFLIDSTHAMNFWRGGATGFIGTTQIFELNY